MDVHAHDELLPRLRHLALSRYGKIRLGRPDDKPEFCRFAWFAMLFQAGIGLVSWERQMQEIMRRHEAGEPVGPTTSSNSRK